MNTPRTDAPSYFDHRYAMGDFQAPERKVVNNDRGHHRSSSSSTSMSIIDFMDPATLSPYATALKNTITSFNFNTPTINLSPWSTPENIKRNREGGEETMPLRLRLPTLLPPAATEDKLLYSPGLEEAFAALEEECKDTIECASIAMEEGISGRNNIRRRIIQANKSPLPSPHPLTQNLVSPENLSPIILNRKGSSPCCPRTPPLKKRHLDGTNSNRYHHHEQQQRQQQKQRKKNKRISLTVPNLLMGLKYPTSSKQPKPEQQQQQIEERTSTSNNSHNDNVNVKTKRGGIFPLHQEFLTTKRRKKNSEMNDFPLPSLKKQGGGKDNGSTNKITKNGTTAMMMMMATYNNNNIITKKAPALETFRRKWNSLSKRKGHISEHRMSEAEQKQLLRDSFSKSMMIGPPTHHRRNHY
ncbi:hypothetical protein FRACYDRAFT_258547 [Fragilariopsis cylindrus CCMP1102]|uniref:Uncharacterized protein n=1 Tax=Fragilariopsis cylindrus CCMP1102 TaxID=635003 RepID=A0A1E7EIJ5_9STRA|nr:hypothetical protein FRACYDRAFT_258547 [Fragilariopsis cylindrus CCMP1102]|eukprot:OEU05717.1 hypothetical protein FRACYDRAFT_258547 [Fragilariopsis cylindrus CCMP1102]